MKPTKISGLIIAMIFTLSGCLAMSAQEPTKEYKDAVEEYLHVTNTKETVTYSLIQTYSSMGMPVKNINEMTVDIINAIWPDYIVDMSGVMSQFFSLDDMKEIIRFYKTPVGMKLAKYSPEVAEKTTKIMMKDKYQSVIRDVIMKYIK